MSKSLDNTIELSADPDTIRARVRSFVTDPKKIRRGDPGRPEICPIFALHGIFSPEDVARVEATCRTGELGCVDCKSLLADHLIERFEGFRERRADLERTPGLARDVLAAGLERVRPIVTETMRAVRTAMRFEG
jgi:tryptophanyl-tRNA synthetase